MEGIKTIMNKLNLDLIVGSLFSNHKIKPLRTHFNNTISSCVGFLTCKPIC